MLPLWQPPELELEPELEDLDPELELLNLELELWGRLELSLEPEERLSAGRPNLLPELPENRLELPKDLPWGLARAEERRRSRVRWRMVGREGVTGGRCGGGWDYRYRYRVTQAPLHGIYREPRS